ncbi:hypothetical protein [Eisenibacter elegans]|jgi:hypothetical protein|uniref:hypothetical protein n=1 Tax=Eisenibacter elegans TaxID=997 RepID=UPI000404CC20|nr:hypothetical protein [Eisenibacter elegans]
MARKKSFALRIDPELLDAVEKWAADEFRSTNGQLEWLIHRALKEAKRLPKNSPDEPPAQHPPSQE